MANRKGDLVHHSIGYRTKSDALKVKRELQKRGGGPYRLSHKAGWWFVLGPRVSNPGSSALPSKWTPATITRKGGKIQIQVVGRK